MSARHGGPRPPVPAPTFERIGELGLWSLTDGHFYPAPAYFGPAAQAPQHSRMFDAGGQLHGLPIGAFLVTGVRGGGPRGRIVLVDAGLGPDLSAATAGGYGRFQHYSRLVGGHLVDQIAATGHRPDEITDVVLTHLHNDHHGWLTFDDRGLAETATIWVGEDDYRFFVDDPTAPTPDAVRGRLRRRLEAGLVELVRDATVAPGVSVRHSPGHTPGHLMVVISSGSERALLLGDAVTCPIQLTEVEWHSIGDMDVALAAATREALWRELDDPSVRGLGAHFPGLRAGRVLLGAGRVWHT